MSTATARRMVVLAGIVSAAIVTWGTIRKTHHAPVPAQFLGTSMLAVLFGLGTELAPGVAAWMAIGTALGIGYAYASGGSGPLPGLVTGLSSGSASESGVRASTTTRPRGGEKA